MVMYADIASKKRELVRKALKVSTFVGDVTAAEITATTLFSPTTGELQALPTTPAPYVDLGWLSTDGAGFSRNVQTSDTQSAGATEPTRSDVTSDTTTLKVTGQETKLQTIALFTGAVLDATTPDAGGSIEIAKPQLPPQRFYRVLAVGIDNYNGDEIYVCRFMPNGKVTDYTDQGYNPGTEIQWGVTFTSFLDSTLGYSEKYLFGGPGWLALLDEMGFTAGA